MICKCEHWQVCDECRPVRFPKTEGKDMTKELLQQALDALIESHDDVATCLAENQKLAGYPRYDKRIAFYEAQLVKHDAAIEALKQALAQQEQPASVDAYVGAREDAAIWKKRALEAEELNRKFIADVNGPTYLGEPVKQEQPAERDGIPEWTPAIGIECAILNLNDNAMRLRHGSHAPLQIADDLDVIATSLAGCLPVAQQGAQS